LRLDDQEIFSDEDETDGRRAFAHDELAACVRCGRVSPPTRLTCLYCGATMPAPREGTDLRRPALRPLEEGERGFNIVLLPHELAHAQVRDDALVESAALLRLEPEQLTVLIEARAPLPLARTGVQAEVALLERKLSELGLMIAVAADDDLAVESDPPRRVRRIELDETHVESWSGASAESRRESLDELRLIVAGRIHRKRIEVDERVRRGAAKQIVDTRELVEDEAVIDLYFTDACACWRIAAEGFDYSCLGARMSPLATENFARLIALLRERAPWAAFDESYRRVRHLLRYAWSPTERAESGGLRHTSPGKFLAGAVTSVTNETQFTRYSRLLSLLDARRSTGHR
jgi:hypothetical protein